MFKSKRNWSSHFQWLVQQVKQDQEEEKTASLKQVDKLSGSPTHSQEMISEIKREPVTCLLEKLDIEMRDRILMVEIY